PGPVAEAAATAGGPLYGRLARGRRAMVERHLRRAHGDGLAGPALDRAVREVFVSYARYWVESFRLPGITAEEVDAQLSSEGVEHLEQAVAAGKGVIMALPHVGSWDFGGAWIALVAGHRVTVVAEPLEPPELFQWFADLRRALGLEILALDNQAGTVLLRRLRERGVVGLVCDRDILGTGVSVEFFGERTTLPSGPATLAMRTGAPILPTAVYFREGGGYHGVVRPPVPVERTGRFRDDTAKVTQLLAHELEVLIRRAPSQWHMLQPNWPSDWEAVSASGRAASIPGGRGSGA
ncbi:MAG: phosphatidylinositol mannoside acyltransferase, partial [Actinomycetota bacterium]|nr:phosphatidylinositol mannoside acyltransferase [Actinomycetota bacterium]